MTFAAYETSATGATPERLFLFTVNNLQWAYTNQAEETNRASLLYLPAIIAMDSITQNLGEGPPTVDISMDVATPVAQQFVPYQPIYPLQVTVFRRHRDDPDAEYIVEMIGEVASAAFDEDEGFVTFACRMVSSNFDRKVPWPVYQKPCNYALYSVGCGINKEDYRLDTEVATIVDTLVSSLDIAGFPTGWFRTGFVRRNATGEVRFIIDHVGSTITLQTPFLDLNPGDSLSVYAGCDRSFAMCKAKFNNGDRHFGFGWMPLKNPFSDNVYGTGTPAGGGAANTATAIFNSIKG